jgi:SAM-dependent methyltransferase
MSEPHAGGLAVPGRPYERPELRKALGACLRPGGLGLTRRAVEACRFAPGARVLDVGCGPGATVGLLRALDLAPLGLDLSEELLGLARTALAAEPDKRDRPDRPGGAAQPATPAPLAPPPPLLNGRAEALPVRNRSLDGLLYECVLSLADDPGECLDEARRALAPGGRLVCSDLYRRDHPWEAGRQGENPAAPRDCLQGAGRMNGLPAALTGHGFSIVLMEDHSRLLAETGARLVLAGLSPAELFPGADRGCGGRAGRSPFGYFLLVARKEAMD